MSEDTTNTATESAAPAEAPASPATEAPSLARSASNSPGTPLPSAGKVDPDRAAFDRAYGKDAPEADDEAQPDAEEVDANAAADEEAKPEAIKADGEKSPEKKESPDKEGQPDFSDLAKDPKVASALSALGLKPGEYLDAALKAHLRNGALDEGEMQELYGKNPAKFVAAGLKLAKAQLDQDTYGSEYRQWKSQQNGSQADKPANPPKAEAEAPAKASDTPAGLDLPDLDAALQPLADTYGDEIATPVRQAFQAQHKAFAAQVQQIAQQNARLSAALVDQQITAAKDRLVGEYPQLSDKTALERVLQRYDTLASTGRYSNASEVFEEATRWEFASVKTDDLKNQLISRATQRKAGQPRVKTSGGERPMSNEDKDRLAFSRSYEKHISAHADE